MVKIERDKLSKTLDQTTQQLKTLEKLSGGEDEKKEEKPKPTKKPKEAPWPAEDR